jgi:hypothetical protein
MVSHSRCEERLSASRCTPGWQGGVSVFDRSKFMAFSVLSFGLCNAPATFERLMETAYFSRTTHVSCTWTTWL